MLHNTHDKTQVLGAELPQNHPSPSLIVTMSEDLHSSTLRTIRGNSSLFRAIFGRLKTTFRPVLGKKPGHIWPSQAH